MSSKFKKKYKALILDVDGTLIDGRLALPSQKVTDSINRIRGRIHVGVATSRPKFLLSHLFSHLKLSGPSIINAGATIIDSATGKTLWQRPMLTSDIKKVNKIAKKLKSRIFLTSDENDSEYAESYLKKKILQLWLPNLTPEAAEKLREEVTHIPTIATYEVVSWKQGSKDLIITHSEATKQHGILEAAKILNIDTKDIIAVGDGYNDFPLFMACGLKVAMGNAVPDLKEIADYIAPSIHEDGVAHVIEKFIL